MEVISSYLHVFDFRIISMDYIYYESKKIFRNLGSLV